MPEYINIDSDLTVSLGSEPADVCIDLDTHLPAIDRLPRFAEIVSKSLPSIDPSIAQAMFESTRRSGRPVITNSFFPADAWLIAVAYIMWEGIIQGMSWDGVKLLIQNAIEKMQSLAVAPKQPGELKNESGFRFMWSGQLEIGNLVKLHSKLEAKYSSMTEEQRKAFPRGTKKK